MSDGAISYFGELDELKESVKRIRVHSDTELPLDFSVPGSLRLDVTGKTAVVAVASMDNELVDRIRDQWDVKVDVEDLNLEDIFLELHDA